ncbi:hypothetical protein [Actinoplanes sp. NPDC049599]|uniref:hypothetical protein n=1 Tax=Actinoplanes sp. NPDC049599 TaxID=3363903 RepID=UPI0037A35E66
MVLTVAPAERRLIAGFSARLLAVSAPRTWLEQAVVVTAELPPERCLTIRAADNPKRRKWCVVVGVCGDLVAVG